MTRKSWLTLYHTRNFQQDVSVTEHAHTQSDMCHIIHNNKLSLCGPFFDMEKHCNGFTWGASLRFYLFISSPKRKPPPLSVQQGKARNIKTHSGVKLKYQLHSAFFPRFCHLYYFLFVAVRQIHFYLMLCNPELKATVLYVSLKYRPISELKGDSWEDCFNLRVRLWVPVCAWV